MKNKKISWKNFAGYCCFASIFFPIIVAANCIHHHNCEYADECMRIFSNDHLGVCVEKAMDDLCLVISVSVFFVVIGSSLVWPKIKNAVSPIVVMGLIVAISVFMARIDPAKWAVVFSLLLPFGLIIFCNYMDIREDRKKQ